MKKKVLITGATGLLGSTVLRVLSDTGREVAPLSADIRDADAVMSAAAAGTVSGVIHTAAKTDVAACEKDPAEAYAVNAEGTKNVVAAAQRAGARLLYISTASVFSGEKGDYKESDVPQPENVYNKSKVKGEEHVAAYEGGTIMRLNLIGIHPDGSRGKNFLEWLFDSVRADKDMSLFDDVMINPLSNWTIARLISGIIATDTRGKIFHVASSDVRSKADIGEMVVARFPGYSGTLTRSSVDSIADGVRRPKQMWLNCESTKEVLGARLPTVESEIGVIFDGPPFAAMAGEI